ncbi:hypothetical protein OA90_15710 [Labrenzia sp. OB1]|nr:hypothetical protein OA90_15710 [Labrenzia sp. OB1]
MRRFGLHQGAKAQEIWFIFKPFATQKRTSSVKSEGHENGSPRIVSVLDDRARSPLIARFLTRFRHFPCQFVFI